MNTKITLFKFVTSLVAFTFLGNHVHAQTGNVGIGTTSPATKLHVVSTGTGGTTVIPSNTSNINLRLQNTGNGQAVIQHFSALDASGALKQAVLGVNPTFNSGNGVFVLSRDGSNDFVLNLTNGNLGIGQGTPAAKLDVLGNIKIADGTQGARKVLTSDANGLASWENNITPVLILAATSTQNVLANTSAGSTSQLTTFSAQVSTLPGVTFINNDVRFAAGIYEIDASFEFNSATGSCPSAGFSIHSYFLDFPNNGSSFRVHSNNTSNCGGNSNHSALWKTTIIIPAAGQTWSLDLGRGQGGNYSGVAQLSTASRITIKKIQ